MNKNIDTSKLSEKFGTLSSSDLLNDYKNDILEEFDQAVMESVMESQSNIPSKEIKFSLNGK
jgi:hypothetical protein